MKNRDIRVFIGIVVAFFLLTICIESATALDVLEIKGPVFNGSDIMNDDMGYIGTSGDGILEMNFSNSAGFYNDLNNDFNFYYRNDKIEILQNLTTSDRTIEKNGLIYTTAVVDTKYNNTAWTVTYQKIWYFGEEYVPIKTDTVNKLSKLLMDDSDSHTIKEGQSFELEEGYAIKAEQIDVDGNKVWLNLTKDGNDVDNIVINISNGDAMSKTWNFTQNISGETDVETLKIYVDDVFQGQFDSLVVLKGIWQISETVKTINVNDKVNNLNVSSANNGIIVFKNNESFNLTRNSIVPVTDILSFNVADSPDIRFRLTKKYTLPGNYEVRGTVMTVDASNNSIPGVPNVTWTYENFQGFVYDMHSDVGHETLIMNSTEVAGTALDNENRSIAANSLVYSTTIHSVNYKSSNLMLADIDGYEKIGYFGEEYVPIKSGQANKISKLLMDDSDSHTIRKGQSFELEEGYALTPLEFDINGDLVWLELTKNGTNIDDEVIDVNTSDHFAKTWSFDQNIGGEVDVITHMIYVDQVFYNQSDSFVVIKGIWQISDTVNMLTPDNNTVGILKGGAVNDTITMKNNLSFELTNGTDIDIAGGIKLRVSDDSNIVRCYPFNNVTIQPLSIDSFSPNDSSQASTTGDSQEFRITTNKMCNITWMINDVAIQTNVSTTSALYVNNTAPAGLYNVTAVAENVNGFVQKTWNWTVTNPIIVPPPSSSSGGGSSGGGNSGEEYENIEVKDVVREQTIIDEETSYEFKEESNAIETIKFTALKNAGEISATIEVLKGRSALVKSDPPGKVYQNMNIWVGKSGFATSNNVADVKVGFKVEKSWIEANGIVVSTIRLCRNHDDVWNPLPTKKSGEDDKYLYFESKTPGFSPFSITGDTKEEVAAQDSAAGSVSNVVPEEVGAQLQSEGVDVVDGGEEEQDDEGVSTVWYVVGVLMVMIVGGGAYWMYGLKKL